MSFLIVAAALALLMTAAYRGYSVILFAPIAAMLAVLATDPAAVPTVFSGLFMEKMVGFVKNYFPVFLLGAIFGKLIELSGFSKSIVSAAIRLLGAERAIFVIVLVTTLLTYGGVSVFVVVFAVYPFAAEMFRRGDIPKRLVPPTIALGAFTAAMDAFPGSPQIQNIIPATFFKTDAWAAPILGTIGGTLILVLGLAYLEWRRHVAAAAGEGYGTGHILEPSEVATHAPDVSPLIAILPLLIVGLANLVLTGLVPSYYGATAEAVLTPGAKAITADIKSVKAIWAVEGALLLGIATILVTAWRQVIPPFAEGTKAAIGGSLLASMNTASEFGFGAVMAALPGFAVVAQSLKAISDPLVNAALTNTTLAGITGSASGGMSIALAAMAGDFVAAANAANIPLEVLHRVVAMAAGGLDTLPHNGAVITLLAVTGLTHRQSYKDIFAITLIKTAVAFLVIGIFYLTGWV